MTDIKNTLKKRGSKYGSFLDNASISQQLKRVVQSSPNYNKLPDLHREVLDLIFLKISRMVTGDPFYKDNPHDIAGYATLLETEIDRIEELTKDGAPE